MEFGATTFRRVEDSSLRDITRSMRRKSRAASPIDFAPVMLSVEILSGRPRPPGPFSASDLSSKSLAIKDLESQRAAVLAEIAVLLGVLNALSGCVGCLFLQDRGASHQSEAAGARMTDDGLQQMSSPEVSELE